MISWKNIRRFLSEINTENLSTANKQAVEDLRNFAERYNRKEYQARYRERHREEIREYSREWSRNNKEKRKEYYQRNREKYCCRRKNTE